jgi:hypothetical protein
MVDERQGWGNEPKMGGRVILLEEAMRGRDLPLSDKRVCSSFAVMYTSMVGSTALGRGMGTAKATVVHKHFRLDAAKLKRAQKLLDAPTETETVERAIDLAILEHERNRMAAEANRRFLKSGIAIRDVFGALEE